MVEDREALPGEEHYRALSPWRGRHGTVRVLTQAGGVTLTETHRRDRSGSSVEQRAGAVAQKLRPL